jgi:N-methylhydantoinase A
MIEIGAGGGGIAELDDRGLLRVGPRSAGADPGPACYDRGGRDATLTDANLALGYYDSSSFLGGSMPLNAEAGKQAIAERVAKALHIDGTRAAWGIHETINEDVARAFRVHASEIGFDYRRCTMVAFGGSGPAHATRIARKLRVPRVIFPRGSGVMSAIGMLVSPLSFQLARSRRIALAALTEDDFESYFVSMQNEAGKFLFPDAASRPQVTIRRFVDMRYKGQGYELEVELPAANRTASVFGSLPELFADAYSEVFSLSYLDAPLEILNWKVDIIGPQPTPSLAARNLAAQAETPPRCHRSAFFVEVGYLDCPVFDRDAMSAGRVINGPAFVEERESTVVLGCGDSARLDRDGNLVVEIGVGQ